MEKEIFFDFDSGNSMSIIYAPPIVRDGHEGIKDVNNLIFGDYSDFCFPIIFKQKSGKKYADILHTGYARLYLISDRMKTTLEANHLTGWKSYPIILYDKHDNVITGYHGF